MPDFQDRLRQLSPEKRALLEQMLLEKSRRRPAQTAPTTKIPRRPADAPQLLSQAEQRLWFVDRLEPDDPFYNMPLAARITGPLDRQAFTRSIQAIVDRHETLRSTYHLVDGQPERRVAETLAIQPRFVDEFEDLPRQLTLESRESFDIETGPLFRAIVYRIAEEEHVVLLVMHHIVSDGWSMIVMLKEIAAFYAAFQSDPSRPIDDASILPPLPIQYSDFAYWQQSAMSESRMEQQLEYWRTQLAGAPMALDFPTDFPRPATQDFDGATLPLELPQALTLQINALAQSMQCTPYMVLLAAQATLLSRFARQSDVVLGTAVANRTEPELEALIGFFVGTLPLRIKTAGNPTFRELLDHVRQVTLGGYDHADLPFERMVEEFAPRRDRSYSPIFQSALVMQNLPRDFNHGQTTIQPIPIDNGTAKYDLTFFLWEETQRLIGHVEYRTRLFRPETISRLIDSFTVLLTAAVADPDCGIDLLPAVSPQQRRCVIDDFNPPVVEFAPPHTVHEHFDLRAATDPDAVAVRAQGDSITFGELNQRANALASTLVARGVGDEATVVVALPRSIDAVASMFAIFKAGGTYVPIDPAVPFARVASVVGDVAATLTIADEDLCSELTFAGIRCSTPAGLLESAASAATEANLAGRATATNRAYIIFTSGSTGVSKGVQIEHRTIVNFILAQIERMGVTDSDRVMHGFSPSFDGAISEILLTLLSGATLVIADAETIRDPRLLTTMLQDEQVTVAKFPPALLSMLHSDQLPNLKIVASAGDKLTGELARRWVPGRRMFNGYGPTEATVGVSMMLIPDPCSDDRPPIGGPMRNMRMYVLDLQAQPVPIGMPGEIYIGGRGVGRGYLNQPELTAKVYVPDPFVDDPTARMYRTGDLGRWLPEGVVQFLGRVDDQISLRGFRIEPGEIAAALERLPQVRQAAVVLRGEADSGQLVAYVVPESADRQDSAAQSLEHAHVDSWSDLFTNAHRVAPPVLNPEFNITGWISTFTGQPIPGDEMVEWADAAARRIEDLHPQNVLEIGCGTGLILLRIAGQCDSYVGTDLLAPSLENVRQALKNRPELAGKVELFHQPADDLENLADRRFDLIVLNSVVQYFPSVDYLARVIQQASRLLAPGGRMFLGDLRNYRLQSAMATAIELQQAPDALSIKSLRDRVAARIQHEEELLVDPRLFAALKSRIENLTGVTVQLKDATAENELSWFRYDVVLEFDRPTPAEDRQRIEFTDDFDFESFAQQLAQSPDQAFVLQGVPNSRVARDVAIQNKLARFVEDRSVGELKQSVGDIPTQHPQTFWKLATDLDRSVNLSWNVDDPAAFDVTIDAAVDTAESVPAVVPVMPGTLVGLEGLGQFASNPLASRTQQQFAKQVRDALKDRLPQYMIPSSVVTLNEIPRTINGKLDKDRLPAPAGRPEGAAGFEPPASDEERLIAGIWEDLLDVRPIGRVDNFFELGGHSMLAVRMMSEIERLAGHAIPLAALFQDPTVAHLASILGRPESAMTASSLVPLRTSDSGVPLFCIHPAGGTVFCYLELARSLSQDRPVYGLQAVGVDGSHPPQETVEEMAAHYAKAIQQQCPEGMLHVTGWSLGGNIAYEVACQLKAMGREVGMLGLIDSGLMDDNSTLSEEDFLPLIMALFPGAEAHFSLEELRKKSPAEQLAYFTSQAAQAGIVPDEASDYGQNVYQVFQANVKAVHTYRAPKFDGPLTLIRPAEQARTGNLFDDTALGWQSHVTEVRNVQVPGDHAHMLQPPAVEVLAKSLETIMQQTEQALVS
ncbi:amino acid adenylation domain-containing protein [Rosistilla oblonga]|uniref:amino acid adenylation domain-containing protein n=1 Tax=Rosistilla oblonga TaxID=2527990 RepID=UPI003A97B1CB